MTADEFWNKPPYLTISYRKADKLKKENENFMLWLQGLYFQDALNVSLYNALSKRGSKRAKYAEEPLQIYPKTKKEKKLEAEKARQKVIAQLNAFAANFKKRGVK